MKTIRLSSMRILFVISLIMTMAIFQLNTAQAAEKKTKRLALLPVDNISLLESCGGDKYVDQQLERLVHVPLNGVTKAVEYVDARESYEKLESLVNSGKYVTKRNRPDYEAIMPVLADKLDADLVVFLRVRDANEMVYHDWWGRTYIVAEVELELLGFDRAEAEAAAVTPETAGKKKKSRPAGVIRKWVRRDIHEEYMGQGLYELTGEALDVVLMESNMRQRIFPVKNK